MNKIEKYIFIANRKIYWIEILAGYMDVFMMTTEISGKHFITVILSVFFLISISTGSAEEPVPSGNHPDVKDLCIDCHNIDLTDPEQAQGALKNEPNAQVPDNSNMKKGSEVFSSLDTNGADCVSCHDIGGTGTRHIDASAIKQGVHANLNNGTANQTILSDLVDKACWACHGDGTEPSGHPSNYATPYSCENCHNRIYNLIFTNSSIIPGITTRKVYEHIQPPFFENIASTRRNSNANCQECHDKSKVTFSDSGLSIAANVSHYASRTGLISPTTNCNLCHMNPENANAYWANMTRHPAKSKEDSFCDNCHNTSTATTLHSQPIFKPSEIHIEFDWQNDDHNETGPFGANEGCMSCHDTHNNGYKICEDCHIETGSGPVYNSFTRPDISDTLPRVYAHTNFSTEINVPNQSTVYPPSQSARTASSCYAFNDVAGAGTCHGNSYRNLSASGGFYAFKRTSADGRSSPYHNTQTIDRLPDTTNCVFCHIQTDATILKAWGNATQITGDKHTWYNESNNSKCWSCHVSTGSKPVDFHSNTVRGVGSDCISCHVPNDVNTSKFARHANINVSDGAGNVSNYDCWTCHYKQNMDRRDVYSCESCHLNSSGVVPVDQSLVKSDFMHGITTCRSCHAPNGYHTKGTVGPLGIVENIMKKWQT